MKTDCGSDYTPLSTGGKYLKKFLTRIYVWLGSVGYTVKWIRNKYNFETPSTAVYSKILDFLIDESLPVNSWLQNNKYSLDYLVPIIELTIHYEYSRDLLIDLTRSLDDLKTIYTLYSLFLIHGYICMSDFPFKDLPDISERTLIALSGEGNYRLFGYVGYGEDVVLLLSHCRAISCYGWFDIKNDVSVQDKEDSLRKLLAKHIVKEGMQ